MRQAVIDRAGVVRMETEVQQQTAGAPLQGDVLPLPRGVYVGGADRGRVALACDGCPGHPRGAQARRDVSSPEAAAELLVPLLADRDRERCVAALLDTKHRVLETVTVSIGSLDRTFMAPREILRDALLANAAAIVVAHNHPSGDPEPSADDERVTRRLQTAGRAVGIEVLDHLVVGGDRWVSLARRGLL